MSTKFYGGIPGSGKTYEVVSVVILSALRTGRRVVSNIAGLDAVAINALLVEQGTPPEKLGRIVQVTHDAVMVPDFWLTDTDSAERGEEQVQPGDLLVLDEIWRFWSGFSGVKMPERVMNFFRMHRHFIDKRTGYACDVAVISQDYSDLGRKLRAVVQDIYMFEKLTSVGKAGRYRCDIYAGNKITRKPLRQTFGQYEDKYFPLYKSHSCAEEGGADAVEQNIDTRANVLKGALFRVVLPVGLVVGVVAVWFVISFFTHKPAVSPPQAAVAAGAVVPAVAVPGVVDSWRVVGMYESIGGPVYVLAGEAGKMRYLHDAPNAKVYPMSIAVKLPEGGIATRYTGGGKSTAMGVPDAKR